MAKATHSDWDKARARLVIGHPFFASLLLRKEITFTDSVPTAGVNKKGQMFVNPAFLEGKTVGQIMFLQAHEVMHVAFQHFARLGARDPAKANKAQDAVINEVLVAEGFEFIDGGVRWPGAQDMTWEQVYELMPDGDSGGGNGGIGNDVDYSNASDMSDAERSELEAAGKMDLAQAAQAAKMQGKMPASLQRIVDSILTVRTPWHQILEQFMVNLVASNDYSWSRPNRRHIAGGMYLPGTSKDPRMGPMVVVSDESGSISPKELANFGGHTNTILDQCLPEVVHLLHVDTCVGKEESFTPDQYPIEFKQYCGGGTDMTAAFRWCDENGITPDAMVILTDGYTPFGEDPGYPVVWAITTDVVAPWGTTIHVEMED